MRQRQPTVDEKPLQRRCALARARPGVVHLAVGRIWSSIEIFGKHNQIFHRWLDHPSYDRYWQKLIPYRKQFAHINIPVLATTGYYAAGEPGTLYYFTEHYKFDPHADQTLLIGPYDDRPMPHAVPANLRGYALDQAAQIDLRELRYQWFDHIFKGADRPALLQDRVNFEVMGANEWRHAASIEAMGTGAVRFYLDAATKANDHRAGARKGAESDVRAAEGEPRRSQRCILDAAAPTSSARSSRSAQCGGVRERAAAAFARSGGLFSGKLDFTVNRMDVDLTMALYELLANGDYLALFDPAYDFRASYVHDRVNRHLLRAGRAAAADLQERRLTARRIPQGSRLIVMLGVNKRPISRSTTAPAAP